MSIWSRLKSLAGGHGTIETLASASTLRVPDEDNAYYVSGSTTVTSLLVPQHLRNRAVTFIGAASAAVGFTHTSSPSTAGQMNLGGGTITLAAGHALRLFCKEDGTWIVLSHRAGAGGDGGGDSATSITAAATTTVPDNANTFVIVGSTTITALTATAIVPFRRLTFIGGASASVTFTNTNSPASGQMFLQGANVVLNEQDIIVLIQQSDGSFYIETTTAS